MSEIKPLTAFQQAYQNNLDKMTIARDYADKDRKKVSEIKPVAYRMTKDGSRVFVDDEHEVAVMMEHGWRCEPVYDPPDTHRVVSVELLERILPIIPDDPYCNGIYSVLCAIIDNKGKGE